MNNINIEGQKILTNFQIGRLKKEIKNTLFFECLVHPIKFSIVTHKYAIYLFTDWQIDSGTRYTLLSYLNTIKRAVHVLSQLFIAGLELKNSIAYKT